jgi:hypothetical protein
MGLAQNDSWISEALFEGLVRLDPLTMEPAAGIATHFETNADFTR